MEINNSGNKLLLKKSAIILNDWMSNQKIIKYENLHKIEYCFRSGIEGGFIDFHTSHSSYERFYFTKKSNEKVKEAIDLLTKKFPDIDIEEHDIEADPFYTKNIFLGIIGLFFPVFGIIFMWCAGKRPTKDRIKYTVLVLLLWAIFVSTLVGIYVYQIRNAMNLINDYMNGFY